MAAQYQVAAEVVGNIFSEYWQGNAFFMAFSTVGLGTILVNWLRFVSMPHLAIIGILLLFLFLLSIWLFTMLRHNFYLNAHMGHIISMESETDGLNVYTHRRDIADASHMPGARRVWMSVPVVFSIAVLVTCACGLAGVGSEPGQRHQEAAKVESSGRGSFGARDEDNASSRADAGMDARRCHGAQPAHMPECSK